MARNYFGSSNELHSRQNVVLSRSTDRLWRIWRSADTLVSQISATTRTWRNARRTSEDLSSLVQVVSLHVLGKGEAVRWSPARNHLNAGSFHASDRPSIGSHFIVNDLCGRYWRADTFLIFTIYCNIQQYVTLAAWESYNLHDISFLLGSIFFRTSRKILLNVS